MTGKSKNLKYLLFLPVFILAITLLFAVCDSSTGAGDGGETEESAPEQPDTRTPDTSQPNTGKGGSGTGGKTPAATTYSITVNAFGADTGAGDSITASPLSGTAGTVVTLTFAIAATDTSNWIDFSGTTVPIASATASGTRTYAINSSDATGGVISINATFNHTTLTPDPIEFTDTTGLITVTYGDSGNSYTNAIKPPPSYSGSGAITYSSGDTTIATVNTAGVVMILKGDVSVVITANKAADSTYAPASASYTLKIDPKALTITGVSATDRTFIAGNADVVLSGGTLMGIVGSDSVSFTPGNGTMADADAGSGKAVTTSIALAGTLAGNYTLTQPSYVTVNIARAAGAAVSGPPTVSSTTSSSITVNVVTNVDAATQSPAQAVEYARAGTADPVPTTGWQDSVTFGSLTASASYYVFARTKANTNYNFGAMVEVSSVITTDAAPSSIIEMVWIPDGTFIMGSPLDEPQRQTDETQHSVTLTKGFYMGKYEVTQKQWVDVMGSLPAYVTSIYGIGDDYPIYFVSWYDAIAFCNKLSLKEGRTPAYFINGFGDSDWENMLYSSIPASNNATWNAVIIVASSTGYRLPTEAQWEYATRGDYLNKATETATMPFGLGNGKKLTWDMANFYTYFPYDLDASPPGEYTDTAGTGYKGNTTTVGYYAPNNYGLYNMHGNVREWCWDWYDNYPAGPLTDPLGAVTGANRVLRGGVWDSRAQNVRSALRHNVYPSGRGNGVGFRLVCPLP